jgi:hypothetical protein
LDLQELAKGIRPLCCSYESEQIRKVFTITWLQEVETDETEDNLTPVLRLDTIRNRVSPRVLGRRSSRRRLPWLLKIDVDGN